MPQRDFELPKIWAIDRRPLTSMGQGNQFLAVLKLAASSGFRVRPKKTESRQNDGLTPCSTTGGEIRVTNWRVQLVRLGKVIRSAQAK